MKKYLVFLLTLVMVLTFSVGNVFAGDYTVKSGDTLWEIAKDLNVSMDTLIKVNKLQDPDLIFSGQVLKTTDNGTAAPTTAIAAASAEKAKPQTIVPKSDIDENGGADYYDNAGDHPDSKYYVNPDFYNMKSDDQLTIISNYKTFQQTSEWSCGSATTLMVLEHFGIDDYGEWDIAVKSGAGVDKDVAGSEPGSANNFPEYGTSVDDIIKFFDTIDGFKVVQTSYKADYKASDLIQGGDTSVPSNDWGNLPGTFDSVSLYSSENDPNTDKWVSDAKDSYFVKWVVSNLKANRPIMVEWGDWDGHWQAIIGYDNNGTPGIGDDVIIFADPYDTSDSWQDGYYYYPAERWFYMWADRAVAPKPYQLQPFVIVEPVK
ncbi:MAG TPA: LysM peptidoglycan-binding domain-containing protein [Anaerovoracaceae bacterium]|nr:LysM peptidoglycan-binding domain-containing protein [Anaerovoracaceae bacterium]